MGFFTYFFILSQPPHNSISAPVLISAQASQETIVATRRSSCPGCPWLLSLLLGRHWEWTLFPTSSCYLCGGSWFSQYLWITFSQAAVHPLSESHHLFPPCIKRLWSTGNAFWTLGTERVSPACHLAWLPVPFLFSCSLPLPSRHCEALHKNINCFLPATFQIVFAPCICDASEGPASQPGLPGGGQNSQN